MERIGGFLDPTTPGEYLEACIRLCEVALGTREDLPDGDGVHAEADAPIATKTDVFRTIRGCAECGLDSLKLRDMVNRV